MKLLVPDVEFEVLNVKFNGATEQFSMDLKPLGVPLYPGPFTIRFHIRHDYSDFKFFRIFKSNNNLSSSDLNNLKGKIFQGHIAEFTKGDGTQFVGVHSTSLFLKNTPTIIPKPVKQPMNTITTSKPVTNSKTMREALIEVLSQNNRSMNAKEIANAVLKNGYVSRGKTPDATIASIIYMDIKAHGDKSIFALTAPGIFAMRKQVITSPVVVNEVDNSFVSPINLIKSFFKNIKQTVSSLRY